MCPYKLQVTSPISKNMDLELLLLFFVRFILTLCLLREIDFQQAAVGFTVDFHVVDESNLFNRPGLGIDVDMDEEEDPDAEADDGFDAAIDELANQLNRLHIDRDMEVDGEDPAAGQDKSQYVTINLSIN